MPMVNNIRVKLKRLSRRIKASVTSSDTENMSNPVEIPKTNNKLSNNGVESRTETTACYNSSSYIGRIEEDVVARTGAAISEACGVRENEVVKGDVEVLELGGVEVRVLIKWTWEGFEVGDVVVEMRKIF